METARIATHIVDYGVFLAYSTLLWQAINSWWSMRSKANRRSETLLTAILLIMMISILTFVAANAYMLQYRGETLLSMRLFQVFVMANFFVYWLILTLLRKEIMDESSS